MINFIKIATEKTQRACLIGLAYNNFNFMNINSRNIHNKNTRLVYGFMILNLFIFASSFEEVLSIPHIIKYIFIIITLFLFFNFYNKSKRIKFDSFVVILTSYLFLFVSTFLLLRSFRFELFYIQEIFGERFFFLPYLLPLLFLFVRYDFYFFRRLLHFSYILILIAIFMQLYIISFILDKSYYVYIVTVISTLALAPGLLLFVSHLYKNPKYTRASLIFFILLIIITAVLGRRGETIESVFMLIWALILRTGSGALSKSRKTIVLIGSLILISLLAVVVSKNSSNIYVFERGFNQEGFRESRGETIENFLGEFGTQSNDYLIGRGLNGTFQKFSTGDNQISRSIEIGYFNILLKGGFLYLMPMMILFIIAFYKGYFKSNNDLSKALAGIVLWQIIYMLSFGMANVATNYLLLWIAVAACLDSRIRNISNVGIKKLLNS